MEQSAGKGSNKPMTEKEQYEALETIFRYIDTEKPESFAEVCRYFRQYNGCGFFDPRFRVLVTDWGCRAVVAYLGHDVS